MAYSSIAELPSQVRMSLSDADQEFWKNAYNSYDPQTDEEIKKARRNAWMACRELPSSLSFNAVATLEDWDVDHEKIDVSSLLKSMERYIESGAPISYEHRNYTIGHIWGYEPFTKDGMKGVKVYGNIFGGDKGVYDDVRNKFVKGLRGFSVAGESSDKHYECDRNSCGFRRGVSEILEIALTKNPANKHAITIDFHEPESRFAKSADTQIIKFTDVEIHRDETTCPILSLRKSLRDCGIDAHAREDGVFIPMSSYDFSRNVGFMKSAGLCVEWTDGGALVRDKGAVLEQLFKEGFAKGIVSEDGVVDDSDYEFFYKACSMGLLERKDGEYRLIDPLEAFEKAYDPDKIVTDIKNKNRGPRDASSQGIIPLDEFTPGKKSVIPLTEQQLNRNSQSSEKTKKAIWEAEQRRRQRSNNPMLHVMVGFPGSGKSTYARKLANTMDGVVVSTDTIRRELYGDPSIQGDWSEIEKVLHERIRKALSEGHPVVMDATNLSKRDRSFINSYKDTYPVTAHMMSTSWNQSAKNNLIRGHNGGRLVNSAYMAGLRDSPFNSQPTMDEGFDRIELVPWKSPGKEYDELGERLFSETRFIPNPSYEGVFFDNDSINEMFGKLRGSNPAYEFVPPDYHVTTKFVGGKEPGLTKLYGKPVDAKVLRYATGHAGDSDNEGVSVELSSTDPDMADYLKNNSMPNPHITGSYSIQNGAKNTGNLDFANGTPVEETVLHGRFGGSYNSGPRFEPFDEEREDQGSS